MATQYVAFSIVNQMPLKEDFDAIFLMLSKYNEGMALSPHQRTFYFIKAVIRRRSCSRVQSYLWRCYFWWHPVLTWKSDTNGFERRVVCLSFVTL